jgi:hypothetical protein
MHSEQENGVTRNVDGKGRCNSFYEWTLTMGECGLSTSLNQFKLKVIEMIQTRATPF